MALIFRSSLVFGLLLVAASLQSIQGRRLAQAEAILRDGRSAHTSVGTIDDENSGSQAAAFLRGANAGSAQTQLGFAVAAEDEGGGATAAGDLIRRTAGYRGSSIAGDIFGDQESGTASPAEDAIRRTLADSAAVQERMAKQLAGAGGPYNI